MGTRSDTMWKVNVVGANITITEPKNTNDSVIFINGVRPEASDSRSSSGEYVSDEEEESAGFLEDQERMVS